MRGRRYTVHEVAGLLGLNSGTIKGYCRSGRIKATKVRVYHFTTPLTGIERHFRTGLEVWMVPKKEVRRLLKERGK
jgi:hypothetical protein